MIVLDEFEVMSRRYEGEGEYFVLVRKGKRHFLDLQQKIHCSDTLHISLYLGVVKKLSP